MCFLRPSRRGVGSRNSQFMLPGIALLCAASMLLHDPERVLAGTMDQAGSQATAGSDETLASEAPVQKPADPANNKASAPPTNVLVQLNSALETLAAKVSPAVVQLLVSGYGPVRQQEDRSQTAFIVRQHAVGSGVIVDSHVYIITNAHVVEGAQRPGCIAFIWRRFLGPGSHRQATDS